MAQVLEQRLDFIRGSFKLKLILFTALSLIVTAAVLFSFLMGNFTNITRFALDQNAKGIGQTVTEYMTNYVDEKASSTWLQLRSAQDNLSVFGKVAQRVVDMEPDLASHPQILDMPAFRTALEAYRGSLTSSPADEVNTLIPPEVASRPGARTALEQSALLNLVIGPLFEANPNNAFLYFVGDETLPVTRAYPNINLAEAMGEGINLLFWRDYFAENLPGWKRYFTDQTFRDSQASPITVESPYLDAAGQGMMVTMFYPLWNQREGRFAGAVAADITLAKIIGNILSIHIADTGFAFLMNGRGEIIAMPEEGFTRFQVDLQESLVGGLKYYSGSIDSAREEAIKKLAPVFRDTESGYNTTTLSNGDTYILVHDSLPALSGKDYEKDSWKIVLAVPEDEIYRELALTQGAITSESQTLTLISILLVTAVTIFMIIISWLFASRITRDLGVLTTAARHISAKDYSKDIVTSSRDEIGRLGQTLNLMKNEIRDYTENLEKIVADRTRDLTEANHQITRLNEKLTDENLRMGAELDVAKRIQMMVLPSNDEVKRVTDLGIACYMRPADEVGGDYYDVIQVGETVLIGIGDVTGHGLSSGVVMLMAQTAIRTLGQRQDHDMRSMLDILNRVLYSNIERIRENKNMTIAVLEYHRGHFNVVGQHESLVVCRRDGTVEVIDTLDLGLPAGLEEDITGFINTHELTLQPDDVLILYTDGVTEAENAARKFYGMEGICESVKRHHHLDADNILKNMLSDMYDFIDGSKIYDDISLVVIKQLEGYRQ